MTTKEYTLTDAMKADVHIVVNGIGIEIPFANGSFGGGLRKSGYYTTADPAIQDALESSEFYKSMFIITKVKDSAEEVKVKVSTPKPDVTEYPEVTNGQAAKKVLVSNIEGLTFATAPKDVSGISKLAKEHNIEFPNWELK